VGSSALLVDGSHPSLWYIIPRVDHGSARPLCGDSRRLDGLFQ
jgi:hypothetical protein